MNYKLICLILMGLILCYDLFVRYLSYKSKDNPIPDNVKDLYDGETYAKWSAYHKETCQVAIFATFFNDCVYIALIAFNVMPLVAVGGNPYFGMMSVLGVFVLIDTVLGGIFNYIFDMKIDEKYGFNKMTLKTFFADQIKSFLITLVLLFALMSLFILIYEALGDWILLLFSGVMVAFLFAVMFLAPIFSKLFNKFTPLEEGELRTKLTALLEKYGYHVKEIQVMDASKRSTKANAYFSGLGKTKTIVLYDTLIAAMTPDEIVAVFAHELGHGLHKDTQKNSVIGIAQKLLIVVLAWATVRTEAIYPAFGFAGRNYGFALLLVMLVESQIVMPLFSILAGAVSRRAEYRADAQAVQEGYGEALISGLKKLSKENLADLAPSKWEVLLTYDHPPLSQRIAAIEKEMKK